LAQLLFTPLYRLNRIYLNLQQLLYDFNESLDIQQSIADRAFEEINDVQTDLSQCFYTLEKFSKSILMRYDERSDKIKSNIVVEAKLYIEKNYQSALTVNEIAAALFISAPYLYRLMREEVGVSPAHYLNNLRIRHAMSLLRLTTLPVSTISSNAGFETEQSFYRQFKKQMGITPSQYRELYTDLFI